MIYYYKCTNDDCQLVVEYEKRMSEPHLKHCPVCEEDTLESYILEAPLGFVRREATTIGQQAERNTKQMGKYGVQATEYAQQQKNERERAEKRRALEAKLPSGVKLVERGEHKPWYGKLSQKMQKTIATDDGSKTTHYIMTGEER